MIFIDNKIKICIVGIGGCAVSLVEGIYYYQCINYDKYLPPGLIHVNIGGYKIGDIEVVAAFDVDKRKVGKDLLTAIFQPPNCTKVIWKDRGVMFSDLDIYVLKAPVMDGVAEHMKDYFQVDNNQKELTKEDIIKHLKNVECEIIVSYLPVGSQIATEFWANIALEAKCGFINCIPVFVASNEQWTNRFKNAGLPIIGDDVKSQVGATIVNRTLIQMLIDRGAKIDSTYQINVGGNTDFRNMLDTNRLESKKISKTESISSLIPDKDVYVNAGPNGCIDCLNDNKISYMRIDFRIFGDIPCSIDIKLSVEDSPNSSGVVVDAIRCCKLALDRGIGGVLIEPSAYFMKHPPQQMKDEDARKLLEDFVRGVE